MALKFDYRLVNKSTLHSTSLSHFPAYGLRGDTEFLGDLARVFASKLK